MKTKRNLIQIWLLFAAVLQAVTSGAQPVTKSKSAKEPGREVFNHFKPVQQQQKQQQKPKTI
jgi:hypothetical protein